jgi:hypothetical protein
MTTKTPVNLADLARSFHLLQPEDFETERRIADLLGFEALPIALPSVGAPGPKPEPVQPTPSPTPAVESVSPPPRPAPLPSQVGPKEVKTRVALSFNLSKPESVELPETPNWARIKPSGQLQQPAAMPAPAALFLPTWARTTFVRTLSTSVLEGRLDILRLVDLVARLEVPTELPRLPWATMRRGVQVLIDDGKSMAPFRQDQYALLAELEKLAGSSAFFEAYLFRGTPKRWARTWMTPRDVESSGEIETYVLPPPGTPILALTDLGIGALVAGEPYVPPKEWAVLAQQCRAAGNRLIAYVPYGPGRWPESLRSEMELIHWHHPRDGFPSMLSINLSSGGKSWHLIAALARRNEQAAALAHLASLATRVEPALLRELRLKLLPEADGSAEADLWFSPLVSARSERAFLLRAGIADTLRRSLRQQNATLFEKAWEVVCEYRQHTGARRGTLVEEEINYWLSKGGEQAQIEVSKRLQDIVATIYGQGVEDGFTLWSVELLGKLPEDTRTSEAGQTLGMAAGLRLGGESLLAQLLPQDLGGRQWLVPISIRQRKPTSVWVGREPAGLVFGSREDLVPAGKELDKVPDTTPLVLWLSWDGGKRREKVSLTPGKKAGPIPTGDGEVTIETFTGIKWTLTPSTAQAPVAETPHTETALNLSGRELAALPDEVFTYPNLKELDLSRNHLETLPPEIGRLATLQKLILDGNRLAEMSPEIGMLVNLEELHLAENRLRSLPAEICMLPHLRHLDLHANQLATLPDKVGELQQLRRLDLRDNHLDTLPATLSQLTALEALDLRGNPLPLPANILEQINKPQAILDVLAEKKPARMTRADLLQRQRERAAAPRTIEKDLAERIRQGKCVPILGGWTEFEFGLGVSEEQLATAYAGFVEYPFPAPYRLEQLIEYRQTIRQSDRLGVNLEFLELVKNVVYETAREAGVDQELLVEAQVQVDQANVTGFANRLGYPRLEAGTEDPLLLLANLPLPVYVTTSYFQFLEDALRREGKAARTASYRPEEEASLPSELAFDPSYEPSVGEPLVYHLFGVDTAPSTLILSEDDYLRYLMEVSRGPELIPPVVRGSLTESSLLFLGHDPDDLRWRILAHAILLSRSVPFRSLSVFQVGQVPQEEKGRDLIRESLERSDLTLFWGSPVELLKQVYSAMTSA